MACEISYPELDCDFPYNQLAKSYLRYTATYAAPVVLVMHQWKRETNR